MKVKNLICAAMMAVSMYGIIGTYKDIKELKTKPVQPEIIKVYEYTPQVNKLNEERQELLLEQQELQGIISDEPATIVLYDIPLDANIQCQISQICNEYDISDTLVYGIYAVETGNTFDPTVKSADGSCIGLGQINKRCHLARMEKLGVDDLTDPVQNTLVTVDILTELFEKYGDNVPYVLMCYNAGEGNAKRLSRRGITETNYTRKVMRAQERIENAE